MGNTNRQLIIIGNGFDLECGLKSSFGDFYKETYDQIKDINWKAEFTAESLKSLFNKYDVTLWDFILRDCKDKQWANIESAIEKFLNRAYNTKQTLIAVCKLQPDSKVSLLHNDEPFLDYDFKLLNISSVDFGHISTVTEATQCLSAIYDFNDYDSFKMFWYDTLHKELNKIESSFSEYLAFQLLDRKDYDDKSRKLLHWLAKSSVESAKNYETILVNFNFTNPHVPKEITNSYNIHGRLSEEIIFGIDAEDNLGKEGLNSFTKTFRLLNSKTNKEFSLDNGNPILGDSQFDFIKFYGHSLSEADYSYFQSIFDAVDLYNGNTRLIFYYKNLGMGKDYRSEMCSKASIMLSKYGSTLDNKDHGKNLVHKLLLEGRILVREYTG